MGTAGDWLRQQRVCFGHQSVGAGLVEALPLVREQRLNVVESSEPDAFRGPVFGHFRVGHNRDPLSKCRAFSQVINAGVGDCIDIALFKFCYVDITADTDVMGLFEVYQETMASLANAYPKVIFLHVTVPLRLIDRGVLGWLRGKFAGGDRELADQARRHAFNQLLRGAYRGSARLFDLAQEEATFPDGRLSSVPYRGEVLPSLAPEYTDDGGHLNRSAAERMAGRLLECLSIAGTAPNRSEGGQGIHDENYLL